MPSLGLSALIIAQVVDFIARNKITSAVCHFLQENFEKSMADVGDAARAVKRSIDFREI